VRNDKFPTQLTLYVVLYRSCSEYVSHGTCSFRVTMILLYTHCILGIVLKLYRFRNCEASDTSFSIVNYRVYEFKHAWQNNSAKIVTYTGSRVHRDLIASISLFYPGMKSVPSFLSTPIEKKPGFQFKFYYLEFSTAFERWLDKLT
jgi:hypothetical protein